MNKNDKLERAYDSLLAIFYLTYNKKLEVII